jgi:zinc/manganese transport system substrate-binding protein
VDCSRGIDLLQVPTSGSISRAAGDIHVFGNTHYWLHPKNGRIMAFHIQKALAARLPEKENEIKDKARALLKDLDARTAQWKQRMAPYRGTKVASYHLTWAYLEDFLGLQLIGTVEPKPGIPPTPAHVAGLKEKMKREKVKVLMVETYYNQDTANGVAADAGGQAVVLAPSTPEGETYADHLESLFAKLEAAFKK